MEFESQESVLAKQAKRRFEELQIHPEQFLNRFDENRDGKLSDYERQAALATLRQEILAEKSQLISADCTKFELEAILEERYRVLSEIGSGAQSNVYVARDISNGELVVLKQMRVSELNTWEAYDAFQRESKILGEIDHPKIPSFIDSFAVDRDGEVTFVLVQSYLLGENLEQILNKGRLFKEQDLISIARQCLEILTGLHENDPVILHRDIKPSNLLLDDAGELSLIDFGVVQYARESKTLAMGTTGYMAPEQLVGRAIPQSDLYSLGVSLIRLATRKKPQDFELLRSRLQWRRSASLSEGFSNWIDRVIDPESEDRFFSASVAHEFLDKLDKVVVIHEVEKRAKKTRSSEPKEVKNPIKESGVRVWTSPDLFVCTIGEDANTGVLARVRIASLYSFGGSHREAFKKYGSGFSLTSDSVLVVRCGGWILGKVKIKRLRKGKYSDGVRAIFGEFQEPVTDILTVKELNYVWEALSRFCTSNEMEIL